MQIKTALAIGSGIAIGVILGISVSEDAKIELTGKIRKNLIHSLGGTYIPKRKKPEPITYANYCNHNKNTKIYNKAGCEKVKYEDPTSKTKDDNAWEELLTFDTEEEARVFIDEMIEYVGVDEPISVHTIAMMREKHIDYTWDAYGWDYLDVSTASITTSPDLKKFIIRMGKPKVIE